MDVFKLLSRSSRPAKSSGAQKGSVAQNLPSSGAVANPQLFGHDGPAFNEVKNKKRKRGVDKSEVLQEEGDTSLYAGLDFFRGDKAAHKAVEGEGRGKRKRERRDDGEQEEEESEDGAENVQTKNEVELEGVYDLAESKRLLRSHKLKIAVLEDFAAQEAQATRDAKKEKRKEKKRKKEKEESKPTKSSKKQLYPTPLTDFAQLRTRYAISRRLAENIREQGYKLPTEVQLGALPLLLGGTKSVVERAEDADLESSGAEYGGDIDLLTVAPTGSGKTIAFLIPVINALLKEGSKGKDGPRAVVVAPTRELASQIVNEARKLAKGTGVKATLMRKGMEVVERRDEVDTQPAEAAAEAEAAASGAEDSASESEDSDIEEQVQQKQRTRKRAELVKAAIIVTTPLALLNALKRRDSDVKKWTVSDHFIARIIRRNLDGEHRCRKRMLVILIGQFISWFCVFLFDRPGLSARSCG